MADRLVRDLPLEPGTIVLVQIKGWVGKAVWLMQLINRDPSKWTHAMVVLDDGTAFEAQPGGAVITPLEEYADRPGTMVEFFETPHFEDGKVVGYDKLPLKPIMTDHIRREIVRYARDLGDVGYNWGTYLYLALYRFGIRPEWLKRRIKDDRRVICSQAADLVYDLAGVHLFNDGRMPYDVTPGDLARLAP